MAFGVSIDNILPSILSMVLGIGNRGCELFFTRLATSLVREGQVVTFCFRSGIVEQSIIPSTAQLKVALK